MKKFLVIGLGSMGKRRVRCLKTLGHEAIGFDPKAERRQAAQDELGIQTIESFDSKLAVDGWVVSTPPDHHLTYLQAAAEMGKPAFVEASVLVAGLEEVNALAQKTGTLIAPSCTLQFHPAIQMIRKIIESKDLGKLTNFSYHVGQFLPDWHPWEKVSDYYVGQPETGGCREIVPFELTWLTEALGFPKEVKAFRAKTCDVGADIDDSYAMLLKWPDFVGTLIVDVVARSAIRFLTMNFEQGQVQWNWDHPEVKIFEVATGKWRNASFELGQAEQGYNQNISESMYVDEVAAFISGIESPEKFPSNLSKDIQVLHLLGRIEEDSK